MRFPSLSLSKILDSTSTKIIENQIWQINEVLILKSKLTVDGSGASSSFEYTYDVFINKSKQRNFSLFFRYSLFPFMATLLE